jgi:enamine deaminase RidA (YjgF/YER057c/UK114 family)
MPPTMINPDGLPAADGFAHVSVATGSKIVWVAGQVGQDSDGKVVEGDLAAQTEQAVENVVIALAGAGATYSDVVNLTIYVRDWDESKFDALVTGFRRAAERLKIDPIRPSALIGVSTLARSRWLIELVATAVVD